MRIGHTKETLKLMGFLERCAPISWQSFAKDKKTLKAVERLKNLYPENIEISTETNQMRLINWQL